MKLGLDFHGVVDTHYVLLASMTRALFDYGWDIHIITGQSISEKFLQEVRDLGIKYTHVFSIVDYHVKQGTEVKYDENGPWIDRELWDRTKADYCERENIDLHIDDSDVYGKYFKNTMYLQLIKNKDDLSINNKNNTIGAVAQLGERLLCKQDVAGSIPVSSIL